MAVLSFSISRLQEALNLLPEEREVIDVLFQDREGKSIIDRPAAVHDDVPKASHRLQVLPHPRGKHTVLHEAFKDVFVGAGDAKAEVGVQDRSDIKDVLDGILVAPVDTIFHDAEVLEQVN